MIRFTPRWRFASGFACAVAASSVIFATPAATAARDSDGDGMPNWWEAKHSTGKNHANARSDLDRDRLTNLREFKLRTDPRGQDTDQDGIDDGDEVRDGFASTNVRVQDTDRDGIADGDEDSNLNGIDNEDEDDAIEDCDADDADRDGDGIDNEDENDLGLMSNDADSDNDGVSDGQEDSNDDGMTNEDQEDVSGDVCVTADLDDGSSDD